MSPPETPFDCLGAPGDFRPATTETNGYAAEQCRVWLTWSAAQIEASLRGDAAATDQLLAALTDLLHPTDRHTPDAAGDKMSAVIVAVQFHDRLMQGLGHVVQSLRALHEQIGDPERAASPESWRALRDRQFRAFSMREERDLFVALVSPRDERQPETDSWLEGSVELFANHEAGGDA